MNDQQPPVAPGASPQQPVYGAAARRPADLRTAVARLRAPARLRTTAFGLLEQHREDHADRRSRSARCGDSRAGAPAHEGRWLRLAVGDFRSFIAAVEDRDCEAVRELVTEKLSNQIGDCAGISWEGSFELSLSLVKEDGAWLIDEIGVAGFEDFEEDLENLPEDEPTG